MKTLSTLQIILLAGLTVLGACGGDDAKKEDPKPKTYHIEARVTGQSLTGLGAEFSLTSTKNARGPATPGPTAQDSYAQQVSKTYVIGDFETEALIEGKISLRNVTATSTPRPAASALLKLEMLADGRVIRTVSLDASGAHTNGGYNPYLFGTAAIETEDL